MKSNSFRCFSVWHTSLIPKVLCYTFHLVLTLVSSWERVFNVTILLRSKLIIPLIDSWSNPEPCVYFHLDPVTITVPGDSNVSRKLNLLLISQYLTWFSLRVASQTTAFNLRAIREYIIKSDFILHHQWVDLGLTYYCIIFVDRQAS